MDNEIGVIKGLLGRITHIMLLDSLHNYGIGYLK